MDTGRFNLAIILFCLLMSAYFSATETAFSCINKIQMKNLADKGDNIVNILSASLTAVPFMKML